MPKAINICKDEAKEFKYLPNNSVLISINEIERELYPLAIDRSDARILTVRFSDVTHCRKSMDGKIDYKPINDEIALKILDFINIHSGKDVFIHCAAGVSRSAAVALYLNLFHGYELKPRFWQTSNPNKYVIGQLIFSRHCSRWENRDLTQNK